MAAVVCPGSQSCLESQLVEKRILGLRLPSSKPLTTPSQPIDLAFKSCFRDSNTTKTHCEKNRNQTDTVHDNPGCWSFIQALSNVAESPKEPLDKETTYIHPQAKKSSLRLSPKSLELCTENLGNETGTDIVENGIDLLCSSSDCAGGNLGTREQQEQRESRQVLEFVGKKAKAQNFPPPLTTIREGSESLRVRPHREGGRLVIQLTKVPSTVSFFQAERSHGRLRLCFSTPCFDPEDDDDNDGFEEEEEEEEEFESEITEMNGQRQDLEEEEEEEEEEEVEEEEDEEAEDDNEEERDEEAGEDEGFEDGERDACGCEEREGNSWYIGYGGGMRIQEKYERPSRGRCKEGDHENNELLLNWGEPLWVATS